MAGQTDNSRRIRQLPRSPASVTNDERSEGTSLQNYPLTRFFVTRIFCKVFFTAPGWWEGKKTMLKFLFDTWLTFIISRQSWQQTRETAVETAGRERHDAWRHFIVFSITLICDVSGVMVSHWWILKRTRSTQFKLVPRCLKKKNTNICPARKPMWIDGQVPSCGWAREDFVGDFRLHLKILPLAGSARESTQ